MKNGIHVEEVRAVELKIAKEGDEHEEDDDLELICLLF